MTDMTVTGGAAAASPPDAAINRRTVIGFVAMVFGMFMAILDIQIVASSLSQIQSGVAASADEIVWVQTSYLIAEVVMIPLSGFLSRLLSTRVLFTASALGFTLMSFLCAQSGSIGELVLWRTLQGFIGGAMIPTVFATSFTAFPPARRAVVTVVVGLVATLGPTIGPTLGGYLTEQFSWHWLFLINLLPGLVVSAVVWNCIDIDKGDRSLLSGIDLIGIVLLATFLGSLEYVIEEGARNQWFEDEEIVRFSILAGVAGVLFFWRMLTYRRPIVDLSALRDRNFAIGSLYGFIIGIGLYGSVYMLPLYLGQIRGLNAQQIGATMVVTGLCQFLSSPIVGKLSAKMDVRKLLAIGFFLLAASFYISVPVTADWQFNELLLPQMLRGAGLMFCIIPITTLALGTLPPQAVKNASGLFNLMRNLGGAFGLAGINTVITERLALHTRVLYDWVDPTRPVVQGWMEQVGNRLTVSTGNDAGTLAVLSGIVQKQAYVMTFSDLFLVMALLFTLALLTLPFVKRPVLRGAPDTGAH
ncbi:DHA2 family efflux MFS transporter permease subunit [Niveispirillum sp. BGYR6]|uniref:DHA2 family efflux MFS transporter permease subunit n=1 Tax=Niveispirillum sp. BGYR6 TaxID=2971249 RepID=UPI0022B96933|nr:DHA2 family efflux MFS transporter permease subunit [Niveispirillum sp. BGYR6]MDG5495988.1 DHA2 family efflux MFS transporter permease subunit [Niveispirillum sp. BGYR6]